MFLRKYAFIQVDLVYDAIVLLRENEYSVAKPLLASKQAGLSVLVAAAIHSHVMLPVHNFARLHLYFGRARFFVVMAARLVYTDFRNERDRVCIVDILIKFTLSLQLVGDNCFFPIRWQKLCSDMNIEPLQSTSISTTRLHDE